VPQEAAPGLNYKGLCCKSGWMDFSESSSLTPEICC